MIFEHEIPGGTHLYFGESARIKREIETEAADMLSRKGFEEIATPLFSFHQHEVFDDIRDLIRINDEENHQVSLRADSTADVVRIATRRLGRSTESKKWFYIQPVYTFPTTEQYQIGVACLDGDFPRMVGTSLELLDSIGIEGVVQLANIAIPRLLDEKYGISLDKLRDMKMEEILRSGYEWIEPLLKIHSLEDLENLSIYPDDIARQLRAIYDAANGVQGICDYELVVSPLFYARLRYYDSLVFRVFEGERLYLMGGAYCLNGQNGVGFALYTDACTAKKMQKGKDVQ